MIIDKANYIVKIIYFKLIFMAPNLHLVPKIDDSLNQEIAELPDFAVPERADDESISQYAKLVIANCNYVLEHCDKMTDRQCHTILKKFDKKFLKVKITDESILVWDPENPDHHNQSVKKRLFEAFFVRKTN